MRTSRRRSSTSAALVFAFLVAAPAAARGDDAGGSDIQSYRASVQRGADHFRDGEYGAARREFQRAYQIHPEPILLFNIASTHRREGHGELALAYYRRFLAAADPADSRRALALKTVAELEEELAPQPQPEPERPPTPTAAPPRRVVERGSERVRAASEPDSERPPDGRVLRWTGIAAGAGAVAAFALAWSATRDARSAESYLEDLPADQGWDRTQADIYQDGRSASRRAILFGVAGGALATTGVVLFVIGQRRASAASLRVAPESGGGSLLFGGRF